LAANRKRAGIDHPVDAGEARRLEAIIHAEDVELEGDPRRVLAAEPIGEIDDPRRLGVRHCRHDVVELADVAADHAHLLAVIGGIRGRRVDVHADDFLAALRHQWYEAAADEAGAAEDQDRHGFLPGVNGAPWQPSPAEGVSATSPPRRSEVWFTAPTRRDPISRDRRRRLTCSAGIRAG